MAKVSWVLDIGGQDLCISVPRTATLTGGESAPRTSTFTVFCGFQVVHVGPGPN